MFIVCVNMLNVNFMMAVTMSVLFIVILPAAKIVLGM